MNNEEKRLKLDYIKLIQSHPSDYSYYQIAIALNYAVELLGSEYAETDIQ